MPTDPLIVEYLKEKRNKYGPPKPSYASDPQFIAALSENLSKLGTLGGVSPNSSALSKYADYLTGKREEEEKERRNLFKDIGENEEKIAQYRQKYADIATQEGKKATLLKEERAREDQQRKEDRALKEKLYGTYEQKSGDKQEKTKEKPEFGTDLYNKKRAEKLMDSLSKENIEYDSKISDIKTNAQKLKDLISRSGTYSILGSDPTEKKGLLYKIAFDSVKANDPRSVVSETERESRAKAMVDAGNWTSKQTSLESIDKMLSQIDDEAKNRYAAQDRQIQRILSGKLNTYDENKIEKQQLQDTPVEQIQNGKPGDIVIFRGEKWKIGQDGGLDPI